MTDDAFEQRMWELIDQLIDNANTATEQGLEPGLALQALMYASARYGAFVVAASSESKADFKEDALEARKFYMDQFRRLLLQNFDEYAENFKNYLDGPLDD
jgi:hypothetical protein